jgi:sorting nexin-14
MIVAVVVGSICLLLVLILVMGFFPIIFLSFSGLISFLITKVILAKYEYLPNLLPHTLVISVLRAWDNLSSPGQQANQSREKTVSKLLVKQAILDHYKQDELEARLKQRKSSTQEAREPDINTTTITANMVCLSCGQTACERHGNLPREFIHLTPWDHVMIDKVVNQSMETLLDRILREFIDVWYNDIVSSKNDDGSNNSRSKPDEDFIQEVKTMIRHAVCNLIIRLRTVDCVDLIVKDLIPLILNHIDCYQKGKRNSKSSLNLEENVLLEYDRRGLCHFSLTSRQAERDFISNISTNVLPYLLPPKYLSSEDGQGINGVFLREFLSSLLLQTAIDSICDPQVILKFIVTMGHESSVSQEVKEETTNMEMVPLLQGFEPISSALNHPNPFSLPLSSVLQDQQLLFLFLQFLQEEGSLNLVNFIMMFERMSSKLMNPDPSEKDYNDLLQLSKDMVRQYLDFSSPDCVVLLSNTSVLKDMNDIIEKSCDDITKIVSLRTCSSLFSASFEVSSILEKYHLSNFFDSSSFIKMVCGSKGSFIQPNHMLLSQKSEPNYNIPPDVIPKKFQSRHKRQSSMTSSLSHGSGFKRVMKESLWSAPSESGLIPKITSSLSHSNSYGQLSGRTFRSCSVDDFSRVEGGIDLLGSSFGLDTQDSKDSFASGSDTTNNMTRKDMSDWKVAIPSVQTRLDTHSLKYFHVFAVHVDSSSDSWVIERRYQEFYGLENKLKEFHGESLTSCPNFVSLPSKSWTNRESLVFLNCRKGDFESFLRSLVQNDRLRSSQLIINFLTNKDSRNNQFTQSNNFDSLNIKKIMKTVPAKLTLEKGQNLDPFLMKILGNCLEEGNDRDFFLDRMPAAIQSLNPVFGDNRASMKREETITCKLQDGSVKNETSVTDHLLFLMLKMFSLSKDSFLVRVLLITEYLFKNTLDSQLHFLVGKQIDLAANALLDPHLINRATNWLLGKTVIKAELTDKNLEDKALKTMKKWIEDKSSLLPETSSAESLSFLFLSIINRPLLNKQFLFVLIDLMTQRMLRC